MRRQIAARVPDATYDQLRALTAVFGTSQADVLTMALAALESTLSPSERRAVSMLRRHGKRQ